MQTSESSDSKATTDNSESKPAEIKEQEVTPSDEEEGNNGLLANSSILQVSADKGTSEDDKGVSACTQESGRFVSPSINQ